MKCIICGENIKPTQPFSWVRIYTKSSGYKKTKRVFACNKNGCSHEFDKYLFKLSDLQSEGKT
jgi:hypothetical protein